MAEPAAEKACGQCHTYRPAAQFIPSRFTADGLTDLCRPCILTNAQRDRADREARRAARANLEGIHA